MLAYHSCLPAIHQHFALPLRSEQIIVTFGQIHRLQEFGVIGDDTGIVIGAYPDTVLVLEVLRKSAPFR
jgi:hypothetical protein